MSRRLRFAGIVIALGLVGLLTWGMLRQREPTYQGRAISAWLDELTYAGPDNQKYYAASAAIGRIGPAGIPFIIRRLEQDDVIRQSKYRQFWPNLPPVLRRILPRPKDPLTDSANNVLAWAGPSGVPQLIMALEHTNSVVRAVAACSLGTLRGVAPEAAKAIPGLIRALGESNPAVATQAAFALGMMGTDASNAVAGLSLALEDPSKPALRRNAARALGKIGPAAASALPSLKPFLDGQDAYLRVQGATAIWRITGDAETTLPILVEALRQASGNADRAEIIDALGEMGPKASSALPLISTELNSPMTWLRERATNAIHRISAANPERRAGA